jgi:predicted ArsR family transcriptional regulator
MFFGAHRETMRASWAAILEAIKVSDGMPVSDLARELKMSYMGVKQHCLKLAELGYLEEWRIPRAKKEVGRPEKLYLLTSKCNALFPEAGVGLTLAVLEGVKKLYGDSAPEKLLFHHFQVLREQWQPKIRAGKSMVEKATRLADIRDKSGCFSKCHYDVETGFRIEEFHNPLKKIYEEYPNAARMEVQMMEQLLGTKIVRSEVATGKGRKRVVYEIATLGIRQEGLESIGTPARKDVDGDQGSLF